MVAIKYSLTQEDYDEIERERRGGVGRRIVRISYGVFAGLLGIYMIWQAIFIFPWKHPSANLLFVGMGLFCIWGGLEMPGLAPLFRRLSDPYAQHEVQIDDDRIRSRYRGKSCQFAWQPGRGFDENEKFFFLRAVRNEGKWDIPKRAVTPEQEANLRELVMRAPAGL